MPGRLHVDINHLHTTSAQWAGLATELSGAPTPPVATDWPSGLAVDAIHADATAAAATLRDRLSTTAAHVSLAANAYTEQETNSSDQLGQLR